MDPSKIGAQLYTLRNHTETLTEFAATCDRLAKIGFSGWVTREGNDGGADKSAALMDELLDL